VELLLHFRCGGKARLQQVYPATVFHGSPQGLGRWLRDWRPDPRWLPQSYRTWRRQLCALLDGLPVRLHLRDRSGLTFTALSCSSPCRSSTLHSVSAVVITPGRHADVSVQPLFNKLTPLPDGELRNRVEALAGKLGFPLKHLYVIDGSKRSSHSNA
jgi:hypothetical protein